MHSSHGQSGAAAAVRRKRSFNTIDSVNSCLNTRHVFVARSEIRSTNCQMPQINPVGLISLESHTVATFFKALSSNCWIVPTWRGEKAERSSTPSNFPCQKKGWASTHSQLTLSLGAAQRGGRTATIRPCHPLLTSAGALQQPRVRYTGGTSTAMALARILM